MIKAVAIRNFQSIETQTLALGPGITAVVGPSSSGKTAVVRALHALVHNVGHSRQVRHGMADFGIVVQLDDGRTVSLQRGPKVSAYQVLDHTNSGLGDGSWEKCGKDVPPEVMAALRLGELNFARQFDLPFMVAESPAQVARRLHELTGADVLQEAARMGNAQRLEAGREIKAGETQLAEIRTQLSEGVTEVRARQERLARAEEMVDRAARWRGRAAEVAHRLSAVDAADAALGAQAGVLEAGERALAARPLIDRAAEVLRIRTEAARLLKSWQMADPEPIRQMSDDLAQAAQDARAEARNLLERSETCPTCLRPMH